MKRDPVGWWIDDDHWTVYVLALHVTWIRHHKGLGWSPWWEFSRGKRSGWLLRVRRLGVWWQPARHN